MNKPKEMMIDVCSHFPSRKKVMVNYLLYVNTEDISRRLCTVSFTDAVSNKAKLKKGDRKLARFPACLV